MTTFDSWLDDITKHVSKKLEEKEKQKPRPDPVYECDTCQDTGHCMGARLYPSGHTEVEVYCPDCGPEKLRGELYDDYLP